MEDARELSVSPQLDVHALGKRELDEIEGLGDGRGDVHGENEREGRARTRDENGGGVEREEGGPESKGRGLGQQSSSRTKTACELA